MTTHCQTKLKQMKNLLFALSLFALISCNNENSPTYKPNSIGTQGKVDVVMDERLWEGRLGEIVQEKLAPLIEYYPNEEYLFDLSHSSKKQFSLQW